MPRGRCHFALLSTLHVRLRDSCPRAAEIADRYLPDFLAGAVAPDGLRHFARLGKYGTHFYEEDRRETWGKAVSGMFEHHPDLSDPRELRDRDLALLLGYISHLTVDEAFRDAVTYQTHALGDDFRPTVRGLWAIVDRLPIEYDGPDDVIRSFDPSEDLGFIQHRAVADFLELSRPWASTRDPWDIERVFLKMVRWRGGEDEARLEWEDNLELARPLLDDNRLARFVDLSVEYGEKAVMAYLDGAYAKPRT